MYISIVYNDVKERGDSSYEKISSYNVVRKYKIQR